MNVQELDWQQAENLFIELVPHVSENCLNDRFVNELSVQEACDLMQSLIDLVQAEDMRK